MPAACKLDIKDDYKKNEHMKGKWPEGTAHRPGQWGDTVVSQTVAGQTEVS